MFPQKGPPDPHAKQTENREDKEVACFVCETDLTDRKGKGKDRGKEGKEKKNKGEKEALRPGLVEISSDGTGFAGGGTNMARREGVAFQC